ncbi:MAG: PD-(D/E)XK motif protein [Chitinophagaceae bacterium]|nr:MAG: PD-(D/E)XK motif protein [Chitinophagaceae bacterium]
MKELINEAWDRLAQQNSPRKGYVKTLVDASLQIPAFLAMVFPKRERALLIAISQNVRSLPEPFTGKGMKLQLLSSQEDQIQGYVMLALSDSSFSQVFDVFLEDCLNAISTGTSKSACLKIFTERLDIWKRMLETYSETGLSLSAQQGLFGEMIILMRLLKKFPDKSLELVTAWQGPDKFHQDFQSKDWGIEVKTTTGSDAVIIANENQLSAAGLNHLFLWHLVVERNKGQGATLNDLVAELKSITLNIPEATHLLNIRLAASGYYGHQSLLYEETGYFIRQESTYTVEDGFPALTSQNVPSGISEVRYTVNLSFCSHLIVDVETVYSSLNF